MQSQGLQLLLSVIVLPEIVANLRFSAAITIPFTFAQANRSTALNVSANGVEL